MHPFPLSLSNEEVEYLARRLGVSRGKRPHATDPLVVINGRVVWYDRRQALTVETETDQIDVTIWGHPRTYLPGLTRHYLTYQDRQGVQHRIECGTMEQTRRPSGRPFWRLDRAVERRRTYVADRL